METSSEQKNIMELLKRPKLTEHDAFYVLKKISSMLRDPNLESVAQDLIIRCIDQQKRESFRKHQDILRTLVREVGLFPYIQSDKLIFLRDRLAFEVHKAPDLFRGNNVITFHREQAHVFRSIMSGKNVVISAPTSFLGRV